LGPFPFSDHCYPILSLLLGRPPPHFFLLPCLLTTILPRRSRLFPQVRNLLHCHDVAPYCWQDAWCRKRSWGRLSGWLQAFPWRSRSRIVKPLSRKFRPLAAPVGLVWRRLFRVLGWPSSKRAAAILPQVPVASLPYSKQKTLVELLLTMLCALAAGEP